MCGESRSTGQGDTLVALTRRPSCFTTRSPINGFGENTCGPSQAHLSLTPAPAVPVGGIEHYAGDVKKP